MLINRRIASGIWISVSHSFREGEKCDIDSGKERSVTFMRKFMIHTDIKEDLSLIHI